MGEKRPPPSLRKKRAKAPERKKSKRRGNAGSGPQTGASDIEKEKRWEVRDYQLLKGFRQRKKRGRSSPGKRRKGEKKKGPA